MLRKPVLFAILFLISGCANFNDAMTPSLAVKTDQFDGSVIIVQPPVSASSSLSESWHTLGFEWNQKFPGEIIITVGVSGIDNITGVKFNVDGDTLTKIKSASRLTSYGEWSTRRFVMSISDFVKLSQGSDVKMKVMQIDTYSVSSFGSANSGAVVNNKISAFIKELKERNILPH